MIDEDADSSQRPLPTKVGPLAGQRDTDLSKNELKLSPF